MFKHKSIGRKVNTPDSIKGGSGATNFEQTVTFNGKTSPNAQDSIQGGSAATNFTASPQFEVPAGGEKNSDINVGGAYKADVKVESGTSTNDRSK